MVFFYNVTRIAWTRWWCVVLLTLVMVIEVMTLNGPNVCMVKQKYNITKRVKYRAPMTVRTYEWCFSMPPRCSKWNTEMRDLTRLETEERTAEVAVCCPGYKMKDVSCVPICPSGKTGSRCSEECPPSKWGPNCVNECGPCEHGACSPSTGECVCRDGWQGESCGISMLTTTTTKSSTVDALLTTKPTTKVSTTTNAAPTIANTPRTTTIELKTTSLASTTESDASTTSLETTRLIITSPKPTLPSTSDTTEKKTEPKTIVTTEYQTPMHIESTTIHNNRTLMIHDSAIVNEEKKTRQISITSIYNRTEMPVTAIPTSGTSVTQLSTKVVENQTKALILPTFTSEDKMTVSTTFSTILTKPAEAMIFNTVTPTTTTTTLPVRETSPLTELTSDPILSFSSTTREITKIETTKKPETTTIKILPTTAKFKPKEIWIKPAQKGEPSIESKKIHDNSKHRSATNNEFTTNTTPKTIIVSIIPTSISYATFKKIAFTTVSLLTQKSDTTIKSHSKSTGGYTRPMSVQTITPIPATENVTIPSVKNTSAPDKTVDNSSKLINASTSATANPLAIETASVSNKTNSTIEITTPVNTKLNSSNFITALSSPIDILFSQKRNISTKNTPKLHSTTQSTRKITTNKYYMTTEYKNVTTSLTRNINNSNERTKYKGSLQMTVNTTKSLTITNRITTEDPADEESFHILTEPEHITAVMGDKETGRSSVDLISVISIAGGVMMTVITVAVVIVMIERCKRPRYYEDVRKINDIRMQVMIDNDAPPPYVRSVFHAPLPDPPTSEKCHYQPISTLDRNLKQFMRPVVVQTISPIMLENFRGILECHYDHLPRRSHDFATIQTRHSIAPSMSSNSELRHLRSHSVTESTIDTLCEAKLDVIDNTTAEPLYAEIPCWRPPSEHAIEIMNMNGEAVTEL